MVAGTKKQRRRRGAVKSNDQWITAADFAKEFSISPASVARRVESGVIRTVPFPTADPESKRPLRRIPRSEVERFKAMAQAAPVAKK